MLAKLEENLSSYPVISPFGCDGDCHTTVVHSRCTAFGGPGTAGREGRGGEGEGRGGEGRGGEGRGGEGRGGEGRGGEGRGGEGRGGEGRGGERTSGSVLQLG